MISLLLKPFTYIGMLLLITLSLLLLQERKIFDIRTLTQTDPLPHTKNLIAQNKYAEAEEYLEYFIAYPYVNKNPESQKLLNEIQAKRNSYEYQSRKFIEGLIDGKSDEDIGKASAIASDFLVIGDIRDLSIEGANYYNDKKVDKVVVALSSLGLIATLSTVYTLGATTPIKTSISVLKYAKRANKLPKWLSNRLIEEAKIAKSSYSIKNIENLLTPIHKLYEKVGLTQTLDLLKNTKSFKELKTLSSFSSKFKTKSPVLLQITNGKALTLSKKMPQLSSKNILYASTYGEDGLKAMSKMGEAKFMRRIENRANLLKTGYKGNLDSLFNYLLKHIPTWVLFAISFGGLFYFLKEFFIIGKTLFSDNN
jgi:hypothetical protein